MDQIFNELSLSASLQDIKSACTALKQLKDASSKLAELGITPPVRVTRDFADREILPNCTIHNFLKQLTTGKDRTLKQWLLTYWSRAPFIEQLCEESGMKLIEEYSYCKEACRGLALAHIWDVPALSLNGDKRFTPLYIGLDHYIIDEATNEFKHNICQVAIICQEKDAIEYSRLLVERSKNKIKNGHDLLEYIQQQLPMIILSTRACEQLESMQDGYPLLPRIRSILEELQRALSEAVENKTYFLPQGFKYAPFEGETAKQGDKAIAHTFSFPNVNMQGNTVQIDYLCEAHMRITEGQRVYFCPDLSNKKIYVGHIGKHLPGKKY